MRKIFKLVEKKNHLNCHGLFDNESTAKEHLKTTIPKQVKWGYFMDKKLKPEDFEIIVGNLK